MSYQQTASKNNPNGYSHRRVERESNKGMNRASSMKSTSNSFNHSGASSNGGKDESTSPSHSRLVYVMSHLIGHHVEVYVQDGSIITGIFHGADVENDFGITLKMAKVTKDGLHKGQKALSETVKKPRTMIIPSQEVIQILAKDVALGSGEPTNDYTNDKRKDLMIDSVISQAHHVKERELERWVPDNDDDTDCLELEKMYDIKSRRSWDQFETNKALFGVESTFNEDLYTTKLNRGPHMEELEKRASRLAREINGEETKDIHQAEERGINVEEDMDNEEMKYSAVKRHVVDKSAKTIGTGGPSATSSLDLRTSPTAESQTSSSFSSADEGVVSKVLPDKDLVSNSVAQRKQLKSDSVRESTHVDEDIRMEKKLGTDLIGERCSMNIEKIPGEESNSSNSATPRSNDAKTLSTSPAAPDTLYSAQENKSSHAEQKSSPATEHMNKSTRPSSSTSSTSERVGVGSVSVGTGLSPSSSVGSLSDKSSLNPNAKEFKLNPNAKSFTPTISVRQHSPIPDGPFYYAPAVQPVQHMMPGMPMGMGVGQGFGGPPPMVYNPQAPQLQTSQGFIQPSAPMQYMPQMSFGQPRPTYYMPPYTPEMPYGGRNF